MDAESVCANKVGAERHFVLIRGLIRSRFHWHSFPRQLLHHNAIHDVVLPELAGNGDRYQEPTPFGVKAMMEDIRQQSFQMLSKDIARVSLIGISMGGMIATEWAHQYPNEIEELHLINTSFGCFSPPWQRMKPAALSRLLLNLTHRDRLEHCIADLTLNVARSEQILNEWLAFTNTHPVSKTSILSQIASAAQYQGHRQPPILPSFVYCSQWDHLVSHHCSKAIAQHWQRPLTSHSMAGHDIPLDDPAWMVEKIAINSLSVNQR